MAQAAVGAAFPGEALTRMGHPGGHPLLGRRGRERRDVRGLASLRTALEPASSGTGLPGGGLKDQPV